MGAAGGTLVLFTQAISDANAVGGRNDNLQVRIDLTGAPEPPAGELRRDPQPAGDHAMRLYAAVPDSSTSRRRPGRPGSLVLGTLACLAFAHPLLAQSVSPPIAEYQVRARSSFQLINSGIFPLSAVLEVHGFSVTEQGEVQDAPLDTTRLHIKLSAMSFRIPPGGPTRCSTRRRPTVCRPGSTS